jgi:hypothetical protein
VKFFVLKGTNNNEHGLIKGHMSVMHRHTQKKISNFIALNIYFCRKKERINNGSMDTKLNLCSASACCTCPSSKNLTVVSINSHASPLFTFLLGM